MFLKINFLLVVASIVVITTYTSAINCLKIKDTSSTLCVELYIKLYCCDGIMWLICGVFSVMRGIGEMDVNQPAPVSTVEPVDDSCPYLILDIRDRDEYDACHLITGQCCHQILM